MLTKTERDDMSLEKWKTIDEMIEYLKVVNMKYGLSDNEITYTLVINHIVSNRTCDLLLTLQKESNSPSRFDLMIINRISNTTHYVDKSVINDHINILQIYKDRKN